MYITHIVSVEFLSGKFFRTAAGCIKIASPSVRMPWGAAGRRDNVYGERKQSQKATVCVCVVAYVLRLRI